MGRRKDKTDDIKCSLRMFLRVINIMLGLLMMGLGIYSYIKSDQIFKEGWYKNPWVVFSPFYSIVFGLILVLLEFEVHFVQVYFVFLNSYFGRAIYLMYLATIAAGNMPGVDDILVYIASGVFAFTSILYAVLGCCIKEKPDNLRESLIDKTASFLRDKKEKLNKNDSQIDLAAQKA